jgi:hypothetical protein
MFMRKRIDSGYNFAAENDIVGIVMLEIHSASDLPRVLNSTPFISVPRIEGN